MQGSELFAVTTYSKFIFVCEGVSTSQIENQTVNSHYDNLER